MSLSIIQFIVVSGLLVTSLFRGCDDSGVDQALIDTPQADSLLAVFQEITASVTEERFDDFLSLIDIDERQELDRLIKNHGYSSIKAYLRSQMHGWPNPDTLTLSQLLSDESYARLTFTGQGEKLGGRRGFVRYTVIMLKRSDMGWRLAGMSSLDKAAADSYGHPMTFHETDLPARLRFPRPAMN